MKSLKKILAVSALSLTLTSTSFADENSHVAMFLNESTLSLAEVAQDNPKGRVTEIEIEKRGNIFSSLPEQWVYEVVRFNGKELTKSFIDPETGETIDSKQVHNWNPFDLDDIEALKNLNNVTLSLQQAILQAEKTFEAKAIEAEVESGNGSSPVYYKVKLLSKSGKIKAVINPTTGGIYSENIGADYHDE